MVRREICNVQVEIGDILSIGFGFGICMGTGIF